MTLPPKEQNPPWKEGLVNKPAGSPSLWKQWAWQHRLPGLGLIIGFILGIIYLFTDFEKLFWFVSIVGLCGLIGYSLQYRENLQQRWVAWQQRREE